MQFHAILAIFAICSNLQQFRWVCFDISGKLTKKMNKIAENWIKLEQIDENWLKLVEIG